MIKLRIKLRAIFSLAVLSVVFLGSFGFFSDAWAICTNKCESGYNACLAFCDSRNITGSKKWFKCGMQCDKYWILSGTNPQSIGRGDPTNPTKKPGPVQVKPPTAVSPPTTPPKKTGSGQVQNPPNSIGKSDPPPPPQLRSKKN
jgi:hypothetical protein